MNVTEQQIENMAYKFWYQRHREKLEWLDRIIDQAHELEISSEPWLKHIRDALFISTKEAATKLKVSHQAYCKLENHEASGQIKLRSLKKAAEALGCEFVYYLRPKAKQNFSKIVWNQLLPTVRTERRFDHLRYFYRSNAMAELAGALMHDSWFRRKLNWSERGAEEDQWWRRNMNREWALRLVGSAQKNRGLREAPNENF